MSPTLADRATALPAGRYLALEGGQSQFNTFVPPRKRTRQDRFGRTTTSIIARKATASSDDRVKLFIFWD